VGFAQPPAVEDYVFAGFPIGMAGGFDGAGKIDTGNHREAPHHRRLAGDCKPVLVIDGRPFNPNGDVAVHQIGVVEFCQTDLLAGIGLLNHDRLEFRHADAPSFDAKGLCHITPAAPESTPRNVDRSDYTALAAGIRRGTGFSTIGRLITAEATPKKIVHHQITL
jgi:hypothetical protein